MLYFFEQNIEFQHYKLKIGYIISSY